MREHLVETKRAESSLASSVVPHAGAEINGEPVRGQTHKYGASASELRETLQNSNSSSSSHVTQALLQTQRTYGNRYVQRALALARQGEGEADVTPDVESAIERARGSGQGLDHGVRRQMESAFGSDFSGVRVHTGAEAHELNRAVSAVAFTTGQDIFFRNGAYDPGSSEGKELLAHELTHVVQQGGAAPIPGKAQRFEIQRMCSECEEERKKSIQGKLIVGQSDDRYEREADQAANAVVSNQPSAPPVHAEVPVLQRQPAQTPTQTPAQTPAQAPAQPTWGSKKWSPFEDDWNAFFQLAVQGLSGGKLKPEKIYDLAGSIADRCMLLCFRHGKQSKCAVAATDDQNSKSTLDFVLAWGATGVWGETFRSAIQSTSQNVDGPITAQQAVQRAGDIADQAARGMLGDALWKTYMNCKIPDASNSPAPPPKAAASGEH